MAKFIDGLYYSESHEYVKVDGEFAYLGITDYAQSRVKETKSAPEKTSEP